MESIPKILIFNSQKRFIRTVILIIVPTLIGLSSCTERIDIELDDSYTRLVVEGSVTDDSLRHTVHLSTTGSYFDTVPPLPVQGAYVTISDGQDTTVLFENTPGYYLTSEEYCGVPGRTYTLNIRLAEPVGGFTEYTASSYLNDVDDMDSVSLDFHPDWGQAGIWEVKCYVQEPPTKDWYRFLMYRNGVLDTDIITHWFVIDDKFFNGSYANGATVFYLRQNNPYEMLNPGDVIGVEVNNITREYADFISQVQLEVQGSNPMFGGPPANVQGNISNGAIGFFAAYGHSYKETVTPPF